VDATPPVPGRTPLTESAAWRVMSRTVLFICAIVFTIWLAVRLQTVLVQLLLAVIIAAGMTPLVDRLTMTPLRFGRRRWTPPRALAVLLLYLLLIGTVVLIGSVIIPPVVADTEALVLNIPSYVDDFEGWVLTLPERFPFLPRFGADQLASGFSDQLQNLAAQIGTQLSGLLGQTLNILRFVVGFLSGALDGIFILVLALYITQDSKRILDYLVGFMPEDRQDQAMQAAGRIGDRLGGWVRGQIALSAIIGAMSFVGLSLIGVKYAVLLALIAAVGEAIPLIGPIITAVPAVIVAFFQSPLQGTLTLGLYIVVQQLENNLIVPKVMERAVQLHPLAVMVALLAGAELLGVTGAVLSVPVAAALSVLVLEARRERSEHIRRRLIGPAAAATLRVDREPSAEPSAPAPDVTTSPSGVLTPTVPVVLPPASAPGSAPASERRSGKSDRPSGSGGGRSGRR
jgi:predicted PurR-regulated permease PerM